MLLAQEMMRLHKLDSVVFIPAKQNPLKPSGPVASDDQRVTLTALAVRDFPGMFVSDIQHRLPSPSYTIDMIRAIQAENEERAQFFTLCAADIVENLHKWKEVTSLNRLAPFLIGTRPGATVSDASLAKLDPEVARQVKHGLTEIHATKASSTALRAALQQSAPARELQALGLDALVERYIREHGIYGPA
jgi:nicotinate-nucleotide adenylyltransferase